MFKWLAPLLFLLWATPVWAQNPTCPTRSVGDNSNACASTAFVHNGYVPTGSFTPNLPVIGSGSGGLAQGTRQGNTTAFATTTGSFTAGNCRTTDSNGNEIDAGFPCNSGSGSGTVSSGLANQVATYTANGTTVVGANRVGNTDWVTPLLNYPVADTIFAGVSQTGQIGLTGASETSLSGANPVAIGVGGWGFNNTSGQTAWGSYSEGDAYPSVTRNTYGSEIEIANVTGSDSLAITPYSFQSANTFGIQSSCGAGRNVTTPPLTTYKCTTGLLFYPNPSPFRTGITFGATSIDGTNGVTGTGEAIALAAGQIIRWYESGTNGGGYIYSNQTSGTPMGIIWQNNGLIFDSSTAGTTFSITNTAPVTSGQTVMELLVYNSSGANLVPVSLGPANSCGSGFKCLAVPN